jgi:hypothetical protein
MTKESVEMFFHAQKVFLACFLAIPRTRKGEKKKFFLLIFSFKARKHCVLFRIKMEWKDRKKKKRKM